MIKFSDDFYNIKNTWKSHNVLVDAMEEVWDEMVEIPYLEEPIETGWEGSVFPGEAMEHGEPKGIIVTIAIPSYIAEDLYIAGGEPTYEMHITLAYIENPGVAFEEDLVDAVRCVLSDITTMFTPFTAEISGLGRFSHEEEDVLYASVDSPELSSIREYIVDSLEANGIFLSKEHGFTPHVTIKYIDKSEPTPTLSDAALHSWLVDTIDVWHRNFRYKYNLHSDML